MRYEPNFPVADLIPALWNPRGAIDDASLADLVGNVTVHGVLSPILARPIDDTRAEIIAGHRRHRAAQLAGLTTVPVNIADATDEEARTLAITENLQRADLHPLDEAKGFAELAGRGMPVATLAGRVGKSVAYVAGRMALTHLIPPAATYYRAGVILLGHAQLLAKLQPADQTKALTCVLPGWPGQADPLELRRFAQSVTWLARYLRESVLRDLSRAIWPVNTFRLEGGLACTGCPMRGGLNLGLFQDEQGRDLEAGYDDDGNDVGYCHNGSCFAEKQDAWLGEIGARAADDAGLALVRVAAAGGKAGRGVLKPEAYTELKPSAKPCDDTRMAVVVSVGGYGLNVKLGDTFRACTAKTCKRHGRVVEPKVASRTAGDTAAEKQDATDRQRQQDDLQARKDRAVADMIGRATWPLPDALREEFERQIRDQLGDAVPLALSEDAAVRMAQLILLWLVDGEMGHWTSANDCDTLRLAAQAFGVPFLSDAEGGAR